jgi:hypothetical protein
MWVSVPLLVDNGGRRREWGFLVPGHFFSRSVMGWMAAAEGPDLGISDVRGERERGVIMDLFLHTSILTPPGFPSLVETRPGIRAVEVISQGQAAVDGSRWLHRSGPADGYETRICAEMPIRDTDF